MRIFRLAVAGSVAVFFAMLGSAFAAGVTFRSPDDAMKQGISAFNGGYYELALPAFEALEATKPQIARFYEARIYGDNEGAYTDHGKAYKIYAQLADELKDVDPDDDELAPIAAKALTAVSMYLRDGVSDAGVRPDVAAADRALQRAALTFNDEDAQFELAKVFLRGEGPEMAGSEDPSSKIENGRHWLSRLSRAGHPGAQAFLADLLWRGKFVQKDQTAALNLIDVAVSNASPSERVWIEDIYQKIFCNAGEGVRLQATGRVADWHKRYGRSPQLRDDKDGLDNLSAEPVRTCANGELVRPMSAPVPTTAVSSQAPIANSVSRPSRTVTIGIGVGASGFAPASGVGGPPVSSGASSGFAPAGAAAPQGEDR
ncbi:Sel1 domain-containing protein repeat-containing protein [Hyphomicrobium denitrificans 1NES1]|uniref:Sel1 domain-containing protein repeat-containing protein n=1 Tax=Hyphomicrobium denitrificans 1NES1 TaxID=670307 RepID=N0BBP7_9HYPH|nr:sel1 repeat family protein [Hyphomicrobium denitrificans]AGK57535.1 Sel1 domain-containing protein repeat-containing protein [Hyphomicrobium denitrificans 1NES1]